METKRKGQWLRMSDLSEQEDDRYKCSRCGNVIHYKNKEDLYTFNNWCGRCGSDNGRFKDIVLEPTLETEDDEPTRWVPVTERLPEEKINPITEDFYEYQCTYHAHGIYDVRSYKYGNGHWWHGPGIVDDCVTAWKPLPKPYKTENKS